MKPLDALTRRSRALVARARGRNLDVARLRAAGVQVGQRVWLESGVWIDLEWGWLIEIGDDVTLSPNAVVYAHDASTRHALGYTRVAPVSIGAGTYVGARAIILPGVSIGPGSIIGAGSVVTRDLPAGTLAAGVPARAQSDATAYLDRQRERLASGLVLDSLAADRQRDDWADRRRRVREQVRRAGQAWAP